LLLEESNYILSPLHQNCLVPPFLQLPPFVIAIYLFCNGKKIIHNNGHMKHLGTMIEYTLISSILNRICKMIKIPLEYPRDPTLLDPLSIC
jgi:hypothetical protein